MRRRYLLKIEKIAVRTFTVGHIIICTRCVSCFACYTFFFLSFYSFGITFFSFLPKTKADFNDLCVNLNRRTILGSRIFM